MLWKRSLLCVVLGVMAAAAQTNVGGKKAANEAAGADVKAAPAAEKVVPRPKSFDLGAMDKTVDPCEDFYQYACGTWRKNNPIPSDQSRWGRFNELSDYNRQFLHNILEKESANDPKRTPVMQKIGDMYQSCMDEAAVNQKGAAPLKPELDRIAAISNRDQFIETVAYLQSLGVPALFNFGAQADMHSAGMQVANVGQGGLGLPDRDYYFDSDAKSVETRQKYVEHIANLFVLLGDSPDAAKKEAQADAARARAAAKEAAQRSEQHEQ